MWTLLDVRQEWISGQTTRSQELEPLWEQLWQTHYFCSSFIAALTCKSPLFRFVWYPCKWGMEIRIRFFFQIPFSRYKRRQTISSPVGQCGATGAFSVKRTHNHQPISPHAHVTVEGRHNRHMTHAEPIGRLRRYNWLKYLILMCAFPDEKKLVMERGRN